MKKLTIKLRHKNIQQVSADDVQSLQNFVFGTSPIMESFVDFLNEYQGAKVNEFLFTDQNGTTWVMGFIMKFSEILTLTEEFKSVNVQNSFVPFASDAGGWHFCICAGDVNYGAIYINRWTDHTPEKAFLKIANSLEEFVNGLSPEKNS
jgi:hypothetical protein